MDIEWAKDGKTGEYIVDLSILLKDSPDQVKAALIETLAFLRNNIKGYQAVTSDQLSKMFEAKALEYDARWRYLKSLPIERGMSAALNWIALLRSDYLSLTHKSDGSWTITNPRYSENFILKWDLKQFKVNIYADRGGQHAQATVLMSQDPLVGMFNRSDKQLDIVLSDPAIELMRKFGTDIGVVLNNGTHVGDLHVIIWTESYWREVQKDIVNGTQPLSMAAKKGLIPSVTKSSLLPWVAFTSKFGLPVSKSLALYQTVGGALNEELVRGYSSLLLVPVLTGALFIVNPLWTQSFVILLYVVLRTMFVLAHPKDSRAPPVIISAAGLVGYFKDSCRLIK
jgi:hypothetical protein